MLLLLATQHVLSTDSVSTFFQEIIPFYKNFHIFWNLKMSISFECHRLLIFKLKFEAKPFRKNSGRYKYIYILNRKKTSGIIPKSWEQKVSCAINFGVFHYTVSVFGIPTFRKHSTMTKIQSNQNILHELIFPYFFLFFFRFPAVINM